MDLAEELKKISLFQRLNQQDLANVASVTRELTLTNGEVLFREGEVGDEAFVIVLGTLKLEKKSRNGISEELSILGSGSYVGEVGLVTSDHKHVFTATAMERSTVIGFHQSDLDALSENHPEVGRDIYKALSCGLARRLNLIAAEASDFKSAALHHS